MKNPTAFKRIVDRGKIPAFVPLADDISVLGKEHE
jgi:hypothetical protein